MLLHNSLEERQKILSINQVSLFIVQVLGNLGSMPHGKKDDLKEKEIVLEWMNESWEKLKLFFPQIHLAQIHNHLNSHEEEVDLSFGERLSELKTLKNICDPESILPPL